MENYCNFILQCLGVVIGVPINLMVLLVRFFKLKEQRRMSSYHIIITNLAIADLITSSLLAFKTKSTSQDFIWTFSYTMCFIVQGVSSVTTSIDGLFIVFLAFERYSGIVNMTRKWQRKTTLLITLAIWVLAFFIRFPHILNIFVFQHYDLKTCNSTRTSFNSSSTLTNNTINQLSSSLCKPYTYCLIKTMETSKREIYFNFLFASTIVIPVLVTALLHFKIYLFVKKHARHLSLMSCSSSSQTFINQAYINNNNNNNKSKKRKYSPDESSGGRPLEAISENRMLVDPSGNEREGSLSIFKSIQQKFRAIMDRVPSTSSTETQRKPSVTSTHSIPKIRIGGKNYEVVNTNIQLKIHVLYAISIALFILSLPYYTWHYLHLYHNKYLFNKTNWRILSAFTNVRFLHCFVNGLIYSVIDKRFRADVRSLMKFLFTCKKQENWKDLLIPSTIRTRTTSFDSNI